MPTAFVLTEILQELTQQLSTYNFNGWCGYVPEYIQQVESVQSFHWKEIAIVSVKMVNL